MPVLHGRRHGPCRLQRRCPSCCCRRWRAAGSCANWPSVEPATAAGAGKNWRMTSASAVVVKSSSGISMTAAADDEDPPELSANGAAGRRFRSLPFGSFQFLTSPPANPAGLQWNPFMRHSSSVPWLRQLPNRPLRHGFIRGLLSSDQVEKEGADYSTTSCTSEKFQKMGGVVVGHHRPPGVFMVNWSCSSELMHTSAMEVVSYGESTLADMAGSSKITVE